MDEYCHIHRSLPERSCRHFESSWRQCIAVLSAMPNNCHLFHRLQDTSATEQTKTADSSHSNPFAIVLQASASYPNNLRTAARLLLPGSIKIHAENKVLYAESLFHEVHWDETATATQLAAATDILRKFYGFLSTMPEDLSVLLLLCFLTSADMHSCILPFLLYTAEKIFLPQEQHILPNNSFRFPVLQAVLCSSNR